MFAFVYANLVQQNTRNRNNKSPAKENILSQTWLRKWHSLADLAMTSEEKTQETRMMVSERSALTFIILNSHSNLTSRAGQCSIFDERLVEFLPEPDEQSGLK